MGGSFVQARVEVLQEDPSLLLVSRPAPAIASAKWTPSGGGDKLGPSGGSSSMKKRLFLGLALAVVLGGGLALLPGNRQALAGWLAREPCREGLPLRYWIHTLRNGDEAGREH